MSQQWPRIKPLFADGLNCLSHTLDVDARLAFVGVDDIDPTPIPLLKIHLTQAILMIAGNNQASALANQS